MPDAVFKGAIAIDIGTTYSRVAVWEGDDATVIPDKYGNRNIPSCVAFAKNGDILVGHDAANQADANPKNAVFAVKKLLGVPYDFWSTQEVKEQYPFTIIKDENERPLIQIQRGGATQDWTPEEITALLLLHLKQMAETYLGKTVIRAVIAVPSVFCQAKRRAMLDAATIAGLAVLQLFDDTTAAAVAYRMRNTFRGDETRKIIFVECGGVCVQIAFMEVGKNTVNVNNTSCLIFSGEDFTHCLFKHCAHEFRNKNNGKGITQNPHAKHRLRTACEQAKCRLSYQSETTIDLDNLMDGVALNTTISRNTFEQVCQNEFNQIYSTITSIKKRVDENNIAVHDVVLLGGSMRIPKMQQLLTKAFGNNVNMTTSPNSDETYVYGAAVHAFILSGGKSAQTNGFAIINKITWNFNITVLTENKNELKGPSFLIDTSLPAEKRIPLSDLRCEESNKINLHHYLQWCTLDLSSMPAQLRNAPNTEIVSYVDIRGIVTVWAQLNNASKRNQLDMKYQYNLTQNAVTTMTQNMAAYTRQRQTQHQPRQQTEQAQTGTNMHVTLNNNIITATQTDQTTNAHLTNKIKTLTAKMDAMQRDHAMDRQAENARVECAVSKALILNKECDQREQHIAKESTLRQELAKTYQAHFKWITDRSTHRQRIATQETMQRALLQNVFRQKLATVLQMSKELFAIAQQEKLERAEVKGLESLRHAKEMQMMHCKVARDALEKYALRMLLKIRGANAASTLHESSKTKIADALDSALNWLESNPKATLAECKQRLSALQNTCACIEAPTPCSTYSSEECVKYQNANTKPKNEALKLKK